MVVPEKLDLAQLHLKQRLSIKPETLVLDSVFNRSGSWSIASSYLQVPPFPSSSNSNCWSVDFYQRIRSLAGNS